MGIRKLALPTVLATPLVWHGAVAAGSEAWAVMWLALLGVMAMASGGTARRAGAGLFSLAVVALVLDRPLWLLHAFPTLAAGGMGLMFALSLRPGRVPLITLLARRMSGTALARQALDHTRRSTLIWAVALCGFAAANVIMAAMTGPGTWAAFAGWGFYAMAGALLLADYRAYRKFNRHDAGLHGFIQRVHRHWTQKPGQLP